MIATTYSSSRSTRSWHRLAFALLLMALGLPAPAQTADVARGKVLHDERCLLCHGLENYEAVASKIKSIDELRAMVRRWENKMKDPFTDFEREDVVAYLNATFYKFPAQRKVGLGRAR